MKKVSQLFLFFAMLILVSTTESKAQESWVVGGRFGMSILSSYGSTVGLQIGPMGEFLFNRNMGIGTELDINTQAGTPIEWETYFKYYFDIPGNSSIKPYADAGPGLWFLTGGPFFGIRFGGGVNFKIASNLYIPADLQLGPMFYSTPGVTFFGQTYGGTTNTVFAFAITTGIRYNIP